MNEEPLTRRLAAFTPADIDAARRRGTVVVADGVAAAKVEAFGDRRPPRVRAMGIAAALCAGLLAMAIWTGPGRDVTAWAGERLGIGEPGGTPTLEELRTSWNHGTAADGQPAYVVVAGPAPHSGRYEFITYRAKPHQAAGAMAGGEPCFELNLPQERSSTGQGCGVFPEDSVLYSNGFGGGFGRSGNEVVYTAGRVGTEVESVEVRLDGRPVEVELVPVPIDLLDQLQIETPFKFFIAFIPGGATGGTLEIEALGRSGEVLASAENRIPDLLSGAEARPPRRPSSD